LDFGLGINRMTAKSWIEALSSYSDNLISKIQNRKWVGIVALAVTFLMCGAVAQAQQLTKIPRIGFLSATSPSTISARTQAFRQRLRELGYAEGKNIVIEFRYAEGKVDRLPALATELVRLNVEAIVTAGPTVTRPVKEATSAIPIVMTFDDDPVGSGFATSLARPGGNITGLSTLNPEIAGKQLELLKHVVTRLSRVAVLGPSTRPGTAQALKEIEAVAESFAVKHLYLDVRDPDDIEAAFRVASKERAEAILVLQGPAINSKRSQIVELATKSRLPGMYYSTEFVENGGLMSYATNITDLSRRAATYVDRILKGAKPADLPIEQPTSFELAINLKTAKQIGLTIPPNVLARADKVIR
jgi:putative tryptophan/tyrosine transport system substrate-binding protein